MSICNACQPQSVIGFFGPISHGVIERDSGMGKLDEAIRAQFRQLVAASEIKQDAIAKALGRSQSALSQYLSGARGARATLDDLDALAGYFGRSLAQMLVAVGRGEPVRLSADEKWLALGKALPPRDRTAFEGSISAVVKARGSNRARPRRKPAKSSE